MLTGALLRRRGLVTVAVLAVALGSSVASALLHLSADVGRKVGTELAAFGPNLVVAPRSESKTSGFLTDADAAPLAASPGVTWAPVLYALAQANGTSIRLAGADGSRMRALHPTWNLSGRERVWAGARLARRLGLAPGSTLTVRVRADDSVRERAVTIDAVRALGGAADDWLWMPLADLQSLAGVPGRASELQARVAGEPAAVEAFARQWDTSPTARALVQRALTATEADLLRRMRQLMTLVTAAALLAGALCTFGTLSDLALERRREIALMKALGAGRAEVTRAFAAESFAIGVLGGILGWAIGFVFAQIIGREVFHSGIGLNPGVPVAVLGLGLLTALVAGVGPARWAMRLAPAPILKGE